MVNRPVLTVLYLSVLYGFPSVVATWTTPFLSVLAGSKHLLSDQSDLIESAFYASFFVHVMHLTTEETRMSYLVLPSVSGHVTMFLLDSLVVGAFL
ncbi:MAG: hypothetical protein EAX87_05805 [Candidatus Thorarchaeota archaeon]|nr:hypothetical protein [Candidatus Thorarchaeota archaeon]